MPVNLNQRAGTSLQKKVTEVTSFAGIDLSSAPSDIDIKRSPDAPNMMPDRRGNPIKRTGYALVKNFGKRINGAFMLGGHEIIHAGENLYIDGELHLSGLCDEISSGVIIGERLYIFDGERALCSDGEEAFPLSDEAYIPTVLISKNADSCERTLVLKGDGMSTEFELGGKPAEMISVAAGETSMEYTLSGEKIVFTEAPAEGTEITVRAVFALESGGTLREAFNLISDRWKESFICETGTEKVFSLSKEGLSSGKTKAWVLSENGEWLEKTEGTDYSVDREKGKITFAEAVAKTPVTGEDNLVIEAEKFFPGAKEKINRCKRSFAFDTGGTANRIFLCGNPDEKQRDFFCAAGNPAYWPDTNYSELGNSETEILGYSVVDGKLAAHISPAYDGRSIVIRDFSADGEGNSFLRIEKHLLGEPAVSPHSFVYMEREPLFLTAKGVYAITPQDITGEKYTENRSYFINRALCRENPENAFCGKWKHFYLIALPGKIYLLDTGRKSSGGEPLSGFRYECYLWTGMDARILWEKDGALFFGDSKGNVCRFMDDAEAAASYEDYSEEGPKAIEARWTVPDFSGGVFWNNKTIRTVALSLAPYPQNKVLLEKCVDGVWEKLREWGSRISFFAWNAVDWADFSWSGNRNYRTVTAKVKIKKFDKVGFRVSCSEKNRAFGLYGFSLEYTENGRFKK